MQIPNPFAATLLPADLAAAPRKRQPAGRVAVPPWIAEGRWRTCLVQDGHIPRFPRPPDADDHITDNDLMGMGFRLPTVVLGGPGSGLSTFRRWVDGRIQAARRGRPQVVVLDMDELGVPVQDPSAQRRVLQQAWFGALGMEMEPFEAMDPGRLFDLCFRRGAPHAPTNKAPQTLLMVHMERVHPEVAERLFIRIRDAVEAKAIEGGRILILAHERAALYGGPFSDFLSATRVHRLADLSRDDLAEMWDKWGHPDCPEEASVVGASCARWTGGQPLLAQLFLHRLFELPMEGPEAAGEWLADHPPGAVRTWRQTLARLTTDDLECRRRVLSYADGGSEAVVKEDALALFLAGWIGRDPDTHRWGMLSEVHRRWAEDPLKHPERFLPRGGA